jgi:signal transduction histidine kinase
VETEEQLVALRALGCDRVQGYYWSAPMAPQDAERWTHQEPAAAVSPTTVDVGGLLVQRIEALRATTGRSVILNAPPGLPHAVADPGALKNVFEHLLGNAVRFSPPDTPIVVTAQAARRWLRITVSDYGIGMSADEATRCF